MGWRSWRLWQFLGSVPGILLLACNNPGAGTSSDASSASTTIAAPSAGSGGAPLTPTYVSASDSFSVQAIASPVTPASGGTSGQVLGPPFGTSTTCGDSIVGAGEECDDGAGAALDACTAGCQTRDQPVVTLQAMKGADRYVGAGRHPGVSRIFRTDC